MVMWRSSRIPEHIQIGEQCWAENRSENLPSFQSDNPEELLYDEDLSNVETYGRLSTGTRFLN